MSVRKTSLERTGVVSRTRIGPRGNARKMARKEQAACSSHRCSHRARCGRGRVGAQQAGGECSRSRAPGALLPGHRLFPALVALKGEGSCAHGMNRKQNVVLVAPLPRRRVWGRV